MKKNLMTIVLASMASGGAHASLDFALSEPTPAQVELAVDYLLHNTVPFQSINHTLFLDAAGQPTGPAPGNRFITRGFSAMPGPAGSPVADLEFSLTYDVAGTVIGGNPATGELYIDHGLALPGVSNQLVLYADATPDASEDDATSYTDGVRLATVEVASTTNLGVLRQGGGTDRVTFRLIDSDRDRFGLPDDFFMELSSELLFGPYNFGAFGSGFNPAVNCIPQLGNCSRERGELTFHMGAPITGPVPAPSPSAFSLLLLGMGLLSYRRKSHNQG